MKKTADTRKIVAIIHDQKRIEEIVKANLGARVKTTFGIAYICGFDNKTSIILGCNKPGCIQHGNIKSNCTILKAHKYYLYDTIAALVSLDRRGLI